MTTGTWIDEWWAGQLAGLRSGRLAAEAEDPGVPAWYGTCTGEPTPHPWSAVAGVRNRIPAVMNLDRLHRDILSRYGVQPA